MSDLSDIPENDSGEPEIESPADGPMPDWMKVAASSGGDSSLEEDNVPDWLQSIRTGEGDEPAAEASSSAAAEASTEDPGSDDDNMSDLERLLAEEGIDLGTISEERPEGSEGMSTRDWMISTSDDELVRKKLDESEAETVEAPPTPEPEPESLPEAPPVAPEPVEPPAPVASVDDDEVPVDAEDLPDWLKDVSPDEGEIPAPLPSAPEPPLESPPEPVAASEADDEAGLPDWLRDAAEYDDSAPPEVSDAEIPATEEPIAEAPPATPPPAPEAAEPASSTPDTSEEELPDWLKDVAEDEASAISGVSTEAAAEVPPAVEPEEPTSVPEPQPVFEDDDDKMVVQEDLPDWLQDPSSDVVSPEGEVSPPAAEPAEVTPPAADVDRVSSEEEELPGWLSDIEEAPTAEEPPAMPEDEQVTRPLSEERLQSVQTEAETTVDDGESLEEESDLPDWLQEAQEEEDVESALPVEAAVAFPESTDQIDDADLPDWLKEVQQDEESFSPVVNLEAVADASSGQKLINEEDLPDWLQEVDAGVAEPFEPSESVPDEFEADMDEEELIEEELPGWLQESPAEKPEAVIEEEAPAEEETVEEVLPSAPTPPPDSGLIDEEGLPDWLQEFEEDTESTASEAAGPEPESPAPTPPGPGEAETVPSGEIPTWLDEAEGDETVSEPVTEIAGEPADTGEMPDWLQEMSAEEEPAPATAAEAESVASVAPAVEELEPEAVFEPDLAPDDADLPADADERLQMARQARDDGNIEEAVRIYNSLVNKGVYLDRIIEDLEHTISSYPANHLVFQLMGDAMMKDGRLQSALDFYRQALARL